MFTRRAGLVAGAVVLVLAVAVGIGFDSQSPTRNRHLREILHAATQQVAQGQAAHVTMSIPIASYEMTVEGDVRLDPHDLAVDLTAEFLDKSIEMRIVDDELYVNPPASMTPASMGKPWVKIEPGGPLSDTFGSLIERLKKNVGPRKFLRRTMRAGTIIESQRANLDGQPVRYYRLDYDYGKLPDKYLQQHLSNVPQRYREEFRHALSETTTTMKLWLRRDNKLPLKITLDMEPVYEAAAEAAGKPSAADELGGGNMVVTYSDWGVPVEVEAPAASLVQ